MEDSKIEKELVYGLEVLQIDENIPLDFISKMGLTNEYERWCKKIYMEVSN